jgi:hypothetical protein
MWEEVHVFVACYAWDVLPQISHVTDGYGMQFQF